LKKRTTVAVVATRASDESSEAQGEAQEGERPKRDGYRRGAHHRNRFGDGRGLGHHKNDEHPGPGDLVEDAADLAQTRSCSTTSHSPSPVRTGMSSFDGLILGRRGRWMRCGASSWVADDPEACS